ncbi:MAG: hypothetical protein U0790_21430 [Isosphaeraceae bacterium]
MKTAISLPDELFAAAEALAKRLGVSRSKLYATALARFLSEQERGAVTERLNAIYGDAPELPGDAAERRVWTALQVRSLRGAGGADT